MRKNSALAILLLTCLLFVSASSENTFDKTTFRIDELGLSVSIPSQYIVFSRNTKEDDPSLAMYGATKESLTTYFTSNNIYLNVIDNNDEFEIGITMTNNTMADFSQMSDVFLTSFFPGFEETLKSNNITPLGMEIYKHKQTNFIVFNYHSKGDNGVSTVYGLQYYTIFDNKAINITLRAQSQAALSKNINVMKDIVDSTNFDSRPQSNTSGSDSQTANEISNARDKVSSSFFTKALSKGLMGGLTGALSFIIVAIVFTLTRRKKKRTENGIRNETEKIDTSVDEMNIINEKRGIKTIKIVVGCLVLITISMILYMLISDSFAPNSAPPSRNFDVNLPNPMNYNDAYKNTKP